jgi:hypothetical protein
MFTKIGKYFLRVLVGLDQLFNTILLGGSPDHTISGRVGHKAFTTKKWYWLALQGIINKIFFFQDNHCYRSIEWDEVDKNKPYKY